MKENEVWKPIKGYEGLYEVSNLGNVKSLPRKSTCKNERILKPCVDLKGYLEVVLSKNSKHKTYRIHRLVADTFIPNINNQPMVNHKDENKMNNQVSNLEWCDNKHNIRYSLSKQIVRIGKDGTSKVYDTMTDVVDDGFRLAHVVSCCKGKRKTTGGYSWQYLEMR